uniref:HTH merR-type domain-containing protein n=2 Tax=Desertifilum tharense IPPAS B-1220 TaxID=1781255 RepID=A0A1E5QKU8_9CYAN|nr:MTH895/ArsE family thioredoxin-like protein [Desertifilum tharense]OEJ75260.1 hypothetical protein BH720_11130 [Desertifilum tharense IPPAS B-1220]
MLQVSEVSRQLGLNPQTLYFYERIGLIPPPQRTPAGYRLFSQQDIERLSFISRAKSLGLTLEEIKDILALKDGHSLTCRALHQQLQKKLQQIEANIRALQTLRDELQPILECCQQNLERLDGECTALDLNRFSSGEMVMKVEILGTGCQKCQQLEANAKSAIAALNLEAEVLHITEVSEIVKRGIMRTPALAINGQVVSQGKVLEPNVIKPLLQPHS